MKPRKSATATKKTTATKREVLEIRKRLKSKIREMAKHRDELREIVYEVNDILESNCRAEELFEQAVDALSELI